MRETITVQASGARATTTGVEGGVDVAVAVTLPDDRVVRGAVTLCPAEDGRPVYERWGDSAECWVSVELLADIQAAYPERGALREALEELSAVAGAEAGRP